MVLQFIPQAEKTAKQKNVTSNNTSFTFIIMPQKCVGLVQEPVKKQKNLTSNNISLVVFILMPPKGGSLIQERENSNCWAERKVKTNYSSFIFCSELKLLSRFSLSSHEGLK